MEAGLHYVSRISLYDVLLAITSGVRAFALDTQLNQQLFEAPSVHKEK